MSALTSLLARDRVVPVRKIEEALQKQVVSGGEMSSVLLELDALPENTLAAYCAALYQLLPATRDEVMGVPRDTIRLVPREIAERHRLVPLAVDGPKLVVALAHPLAPDVEERLGFLLGLEIVTRIACDVRISAGLLHHYNVAPTPRHARLIEQLRQRDAGAVPYVAPPREGKLDRGSVFSELAPKRSRAAAWLDDDDETEEEQTPEPRSPGTWSQPPAEGRPTDPMGVPREVVLRAVPPSAPSWAAPAQTESSRAQTASSTPATADAAAPPTSAPTDVPPGPAPAPARTAATAAAADVHAAAPGSSSEPPHGTETQRALRRLRGPLTPAAAARMLQGATERDEVLEIFFAFARQFFEYSALFVVQNDVAHGRDAFGTGAPPEAVRTLAVPLDAPGALAEVRRTLEARIGRLSIAEQDTRLLAALQRPRDAFAIVLPVVIRGRAVLLLYADRANEAFEISDVPELVAFVPRIVDALERLILRRKRARASFGATARTSPEERTRLKDAARSLAGAWARTPSGAASTAERSRWEAGPSAANDAARDPEDAPTDRDRRARRESLWESTDADVTPTARRQRRVSSSSLQAAGALAAEASDAPPAASAAARVDIMAIAQPGAERSRTLQAMLGIPRDAPPPPDTDIALPPASDPPPADPSATSDPPEDDEPELTIAALDSGEVGILDEHEPAERGAGAGVRASTYMMHDAAVDVVTRRPRPPAASPRTPRHDPRVEEAGRETPVPQDVVRLPALGGRRAASMPSGPGKRSSPPVSNDLPTVIVDMGEQINALVAELSECKPGDEAPKVAALLAIGEAALATLAQAFPGLPWFDRQRSHRPLPAGRDVSAIARAIVAFRERAVPYVASLLGAGQADRRFLATLVAGDLVHPGLVHPLADRAFDDDEDVRAAAVEILPRFRRFTGEWNEAMTVIRRAAKIRGRDPSRRHRAARALGNLKDAGAVRLLVELLDEQDRTLAALAHRALVEITCEDMGSTSRRWTSWLQKNEGRHRIEWLIDALGHGDEAIRAAAGEELKALTQQYYGFHAGSPRKDREIVQQKYRRWWEEEGRQAFGGRG